MISQKFSVISDDRLAAFISGCNERKECDNILDSVESVSDLWILAKMNDVYNEENHLHSSAADPDSGVCAPR